MREGIERLVRMARSRSHLLDGSSFGIWMAVVELERLEARKARVARWLEPLLGKEHP